MRTLARKIKRELEVHEAEHYAAYEIELQRIWPLDEEKSKVKNRTICEGIGISLGLLEAGIVRHLPKRFATKAAKLGHYRF